MHILRQKHGQGLIEYVLVVALMGILTISALNKLGDKTREGFNSSTTKLNNEFERIRP